jgi:hypothetical protein
METSSRDLPSVSATADSTDNYSRFVQDTGSTVTVAGLIRDLVLPTVNAVSRNVRQARAVKDSLGHWKEDAFAEGEPLTPEIELDKFEDHIVQKNGILQPSSTQKPRSKWAKWAFLLHALEITPEAGVVTWKHQEESNDTESYGMALEMDGAVLCHILNLYEMKTPMINCGDFNFKKDPPRWKSTLPFGQLAWEVSGEKTLVSFRPKAKDKLEAIKRPLGDVGPYLDEETLMITYLNTLEWGVSDPELRWPDSSSPLSERIRKFNTNLEAVIERKKPLLLTYKWLEPATRVKKRVLCQGPEENTAFRDDVLARLEETTEITQLPNVETHRQYLRERFLFGEDHLFYGVCQREKTEISSKYLLERIVSDTLNSYESQPAGSWKHELFLLKDDVKKLFWFGQNPKCVNLVGRIRLLEFNREDDLWNRPVVIQP